MSQSTIPWKKILIGLGVLGGIGLVFLVVAGMVLKHAAEDFLVKFETDLPALAEEGVQFAASHDQADCIDEGLKRVLPCGSLDMTCLMGAGLFGQSCLDAAVPDPAVCEGVPDISESTTVGVWAQQACAERGHPESAPCVTFMTQALVGHCAQDRTNR